MAPSAITERNRAIITDYARMRAAGQSYEAHDKYDARLRIEHDPWIADGLGGDEAFIRRREAEQPDKYDPVNRYVNVQHNLVVDGAFAAIKSHVFTNAGDPGRVFVDIWRLEEGKIAEHWDVIQPVDPDYPPSATFGCEIGATYEQGRQAGDTVTYPACGRPDPAADAQANRRIVLDCLARESEPAGLADAITLHYAQDFVQRSPAGVPSTPAGRLAHLQPLLERQRADNWQWETGRVLADGDLVLVHRRGFGEADPTGVARVDLFRLAGGRITERWEVSQPIPRFSVSGRAMVGGPDAPLEPGRVKGIPG